MWSPPTPTVGNDSLCELIDGVKAFNPKMTDFHQAMLEGLETDLRPALQTKRYRALLEGCREHLEAAVSTASDLEGLLVDLYMDRQGRITEERDACVAIARECATTSVLQFLTRSSQGVGEDLATRFSTVRLEADADEVGVRAQLADLAERDAATASRHGGPDSAARAHCGKLVAAAIRDRSSSAILRPFKALFRTTGADDPQDWPAVDVTQAIEAKNPRVKAKKETRRAAVMSPAKDDRPKGDAHFWTGYACGIITCLSPARLSDDGIELDHEPEEPSTSIAPVDGELDANRSPDEDTASGVALGQVGLI